MPYNTDGVNTVCTPTAINTCPDKYSCQKALYGSNYICCPVPGSNLLALIHQLLTVNLCLGLVKHIMQNFNVNNLIA